MKTRPPSIFYEWCFSECPIRLSGKTSFNFISVGTLKKIKIPLPPLKIQKQIVAEIEAEQKGIKECKKLIDRHEQKIKERVGEVWGE